MDGTLDPRVVGRLAAQGMTTGLTVIEGRYCILAGLRTGLMLEHIARMVGADTPQARMALGEDGQQDRR